ncbi:MAG: hypothetical protein HY074_08675 [Deltaproteobacteria bacterium]|nr:hypothetical protein [Deltaproteobacteria bacterium]
MTPCIEKAHVLGYTVDKLLMAAFWMKKMIKALIKSIFTFIGVERVSAKKKPSEPRSDIDRDIQTLVRSLKGRTLKNTSNI